LRKSVVTLVAFSFLKRYSIFFREYQKNEDVTDFDSLATADKVGKRKDLANKRFKDKHYKKPHFYEAFLVCYI